MSQISEMDDDLRPEYDFTQLTVVARGQGRERSRLTVQLEPDVATFFPDSGAVNEGLRLLMRLIQQSPAQQSSAQQSPVQPSLQTPDALQNGIV
jgi:hypothetical protein